MGQWPEPHFHRGLAHPHLFSVVKRKTKGIAEGGKSALSRVGFSAFECEFMGSPRGRGLGFATARALAYDGDVAGPHADPHLGDIGGFMIVARISVPHATAGKSPPIPSIIAKDAVCFGDDVPPLDIVKVSPIRFTRLDVLASSFALSCMTWVSLSAITWSSR